MEIKSVDTTPSLTIQLLGLFEVRANGQLLEFGRRRKAQYLLALLVLNADKDVDRRFLANAIWPDKPDKDEDRSLERLRTTLQELRKILGSEKKCIIAFRNTIRLDLTSAYVDIIAFDEAINGNPPSLLEAIKLYAGPFMKGCLEDWAEVERTELERKYIAALETLVRKAIKEGKLNSAIGYLRSATSTEDLREELIRLLMETLAHQGDYTGAKLVYRNLRLQVKSRDPESEPTPMTTDLYKQIIEKAADHSKQEKLIGPIRIPRLPHRLIGREEITQNIQAQYRSSAQTRLVTLVGTGGVGKTILAQKVGIGMVENNRKDYGNGALFVDLSSLRLSGNASRDADLVSQAVAAKLSVCEQPGQPITETLVSFLCAWHLFLVLDNCEHVREECGRFVQKLRGGCPHVRILATSRERLQVAGEIEWLVNPLEFPSDDLLESGNKNLLSDILKCPAIKLFEERVKQRHPGFQVTEQNMKVVMQICQHLDGLPLAIELAAARVGVLTVEQIAQRMDDRFHLLTEGNVSGPKRHISLEAAFEGSYGLLDKEEQTMFRRLSVFHDGFMLEAAWKVTQPGCKDDLKAIKLLDHLIKKSLVVSRLEEGRYRILESLRAFATEKLRPADRAKSNHLHADYYTRFAEEAKMDLDGPEQAERLQQLHREYGNFRAALAWCLQHNAALGMRLGGALWRFWHIRGYLSEGLEFLEGLIHSTEQEASQECAEVLNGAAVLAHCLLDYTKARSLYNDCISMRRKLISTRQERKDMEGLAGTLGNLSNLEREQGDLESAKQCWTESLEIQKNIDDHDGIAHSYYNKGLGYFAAEKWEEAREAVETARILFKNPRGQAACLGTLGLLDNRQEQPLQACQRLKESYKLFESLLDEEGMVFALAGLGDSYLLLKDISEAKENYRECLRILRKIRRLDHIAEKLELLAGIAYKEAEASQKNALQKHFSIRATQLYGTADAIRMKAALPDRMASNQKQYDERITSLRLGRLGLGQTLFDDTVKRGSQMSLEQAIAYALEEGT